MKKTILFTILCTAGVLGASHLLGMEPEWSLPKVEHISQLPRDVQEKIGAQKIIAQKMEEAHKMLQRAFEYKNLHMAVRAIKEISALGGIHYDNLKDFTILVNILALKLGPFHYEIAYAFNTPTAKKYIDLSEKLRQAIEARKPQEVLESIEEIINEGGSIDAILGDVSALHMALNSTLNLLYLGAFDREERLKGLQSVVEIVGLLLKYGANPYAKSWQVSGGDKIPLEYVKSINLLSRYPEIKASLEWLLENAMKNYPPSH